MKAARFYRERTGLTVEEVAEPVAGPGEVVVAVRAAGLCGTDVHIAAERSFPTAKSPITLGHEGAGVVTALGTDVSGWAVGDRVTFYPSIPCGACRSCRHGRLSLCPEARIFGVHVDGTFAEAVSVPAPSLVRLPDRVPFAVGAILSDAVATAYHAVTKRAVVCPGETVAVFGCGGVGYHGVLFVRRAVAARIVAVDTAAGALARARQAGATDVVDARAGEPSKAIRALTSGEGVDVALEFVGRTATVVEALRSVARPGRVIVVGVGSEQVELPPLTTFVGKELALVGSMGSYREDLEEVLALLASGQLDLAGSVTHELPLAEVDAALDLLAHRTGDPVRVVLTS
jgi:threonine dehydrogenase-like Zn-dependent dehydrogenase